MCNFYDKIEILKGLNSSQPTVYYDHKCSKVFINELGQEVRIVDCAYFKSFTDCKYFENKNNKQN